MKYLILIALMMVPTLARAEGKIGAATLTDQDRYGGYRYWLSIYEPVSPKWNLGLYGQHERGPQDSGSNIYVKVGGYYDLTKRLNLSVFGETTQWQAPSMKPGPNFNSNRIGLGAEFKLW